MQPVTITRDAVVGRPIDLVARTWSRAAFVRRLIGNDHELVLLPVSVDAPDGDRRRVTRWRHRGMQATLTLRAVTPGVTVMMLALTVRSGGMWLAAKTGLLGRVVDHTLEQAREILESESAPDASHGFADAATG